MNFSNLFPNSTKCIKLPIVINIDGIIFIPDDIKDTILNETLECNHQYMVTVNSSSGLALTKNGVPFTPIWFINLIDEYPDYTQHDKGIFQYYDNIFNWSELKMAIEDRIRSSDLIKYDENISHNLDLFLICTKI